MLNMTQRKPQWKFAVYSPPGMGKTHLSVTMPKPLCLLSELHGFETIRTAASMCGKPTPPTIWIRKLSQLDRILSILATNAVDPLVQMMMDPAVVFESDLTLSDDDGNAVTYTRKDFVAALPYVKPMSVSFDSVSEIGDMFGSMVDAQGGKEVKDGLEFRKRNAWGPIEEKMSAFLRRARDLPYNVLFIALVNERNHGTDDTPDIRFEPMLPGKKLPKRLASVCNAVGFMRIAKSRVGSGKNTRVELTRSVRFVAPDVYMQKCATPLRNDEAPDVSAWIEALSVGEVIAGPTHVVANVSDDFDEVDDEDEDDDSPV